MLKIFFLVFSFNLLLANNTVFNPDQELVELNKRFTNKVIEEKYESFLTDTLLSKDELFKKIDRDDKDWLLGMDYLFNQNFTTKIGIKSSYTYKKENISVKLPLYRKALEHLYISSKKNNVLSAYLGANMIINSFFSLDSSGKFMNNDTKELINLYFPTFINVLIKNNYCFGYVFGVVYQESSLIETNNVLKYDLIVKGLDHCSDKHPFYMRKSLLQKKKHIDAILKLRGK